MINTKYQNISLLNPFIPAPEGFGALPLEFGTTPKLWRSCRAQAPAGIIPALENLWEFFWGGWDLSSNLPQQFQPRQICSLISAKQIRANSNQGIRMGSKIGPDYLECSVGGV